MNRYFHSSKMAKRQNSFYFLSHEKKKQTGVDYTYQIVYDGYQNPEVKILSPQLIGNPPHTYEDGSLCLYYPEEQPWSNRTCSICNCIIPWVHEWIVFYEIYLITGEWEHPEVSHSNQ